MVYIGLFVVALGAATLLPLQSEAALLALLLAGHEPVAVIAVATAGNVLGSLVNYGLGRYLQLYRGRRWFPVSDEALRRGEQHYRRFGRWSLLASWMPFVGDPLTLIAGVLRERIGVFLLLVTLAKGGRYVVLAVLAGSVQGFFSAAV